LSAKLFIYISNDLLYFDSSTTLQQENGRRANPPSPAFQAVCCIRVTVTASNINSVVNRENEWPQ